MDVREKLVELLNEIIYGGFKLHNYLYESGEQLNNDDIASFLVANGVTVQALDCCKYCEEYEDLPEHFVSGKPVGRVFDTCIQTDENGRWHIEVPSGADIGIKFCPMCGRKLPQPPKGE